MVTPTLTLTLTLALTLADPNPNPNPNPNPRCAGCLFLCMSESTEDLIVNSVSIRYKEPGLQTMFSLVTDI